MVLDGPDERGTDVALAGEPVDDDRAHEPRHPAREPPHGCGVGGGQPRRDQLGRDVRGVERRQRDLLHPAVADEVGDRGRHPAGGRGQHERRALARRGRREHGERRRVEEVDVVDQHAPAGGGGGEEARRGRDEHGGVAGRGGGEDGGHRGQRCPARGDRPGQARDASSPVGQATADLVQQRRPPVAPRAGDEHVAAAEARSHDALDVLAAAAEVGAHRRRTVQRAVGRPVGAAGSGRAPRAATPPGRR